MQSSIKFMLMTEAISKEAGGFSHTKGYNQ